MFFREKLGISTCMEVEQTIGSDEYYGTRFYYYFYIWRSGLLHTLNSITGMTRGESENIISHSCIHDQILEQRKKPGHKVYSVTPQVYRDSSIAKPLYGRDRALLGLSNLSIKQREAKYPIRIYLNYDAVGRSFDGDCQNIGVVVKLGEPSSNSVPSSPCNAHGDPPAFSDCWYNCTLEDISVEDKQQRLRKALGQTVDWFGRALAVEPVKVNLRLSGYSACGQDGGVQLPREYVEEGFADADLVLLVTT